MHLLFQRFVSLYFCFVQCFNRPIMECPRHTPQYKISNMLILNQIYWLCAAEITTSKFLLQLMEEKEKKVKEG
jgi:hypothetical protein